MTARVLAPASAGLVLADGAPTVAAAIPGYLTTLRTGRAEGTVSTYRTGLHRFCEYLQATGLPPASTLTTEIPRIAAEDFVVALALARPDHQSKSTVWTYINAVRSFYRYLYRRRIGPRESTYQEMQLGLKEVMGRFQYRTPRIDRRLPAVGQYVIALPEPVGRRAAPRGGRKYTWLALLRDQAIMRTLFCTGMRAAELCGLNRGDIDEGRVDQALITGKGNKERVVFFDQPTLEAIRRYLEARADHYQPLFLKHHRGRRTPGPSGEYWRLATNGLWWIVKKYAGLAGVSATTHHFRHAKASLMLNNGASLSEVQDILGHASPETTKRIYAHYDNAHLRKAFDRSNVSLDEALATR